MSLWTRHTEKHTKLKLIFQYQMTPTPPPGELMEATEIVMYEMLSSMNERQGQRGREHLLYYQRGVLPGGMIRRDTRAGWVLWKLLE